MPTNTDASLVVHDFLKTGTLASTVRALVVAGADNVFEAGDLTEDELNSAETTRRTNDTDKVLAISVHDAGEVPDRVKHHYHQTVVIRIFDRRRGNRNIRATRLAIKNLLDPDRFRSNLDEGLGRGILSSTYVSRTGYRWDRFYAAEYEAITYDYHVVQKEDRS